jgi:hypothetical protein
MKRITTVFGLLRPSANPPPPLDDLSEKYVYRYEFDLKEYTKEERTSGAKVAKEFHSFALTGLRSNVYKANLYYSPDASYIIFVDLKLYTAKQFVENELFVDPFMNPEFLKYHFRNFAGNVKGALVKLEKRGEVTLSYCKEAMPIEIYDGPFEGLDWNWFKMFIHWWLIVPKAQTEWKDIWYQMYCFDIAHQGWFPKVVHFFTIPANICFTLAFLAQFKLGSSDIPLSTASAVAFGCLYLANGFHKKLRMWGVFTFVSILLLSQIANMWMTIYQVAGQPWYSPTSSFWTNPLVCCYIASLIEAFSHIIVPQLPPYIVGVNRWFDTSDFFSSGSKFYLFWSAVSSVTTSPLVSYISCPHLIGNLVLFQMMTAGYKPEIFREYKRIVGKVMATGNPALDDIPTTFNQMFHGMPGTSGAPNTNPDNKNNSISL